MSTQTIAPLNDPSLPTRLASERQARGDLATLVLHQHDDQGHSGAPRFCEWAACRLASEQSGR